MERTSWAVKFAFMFLAISSTSGDHSVSTARSNVTSTTAPANEARMTLAIRMNLSISMAYKGELENSYSEDYIHLAENTKSTVNDVFNGLNGFLSIKINSFREGSVIVVYDLQFDGETNLTMLLDDFAQRLERLEQATIDGSNVTVDSNTMNAQFRKAADYQVTGNICEIAYCNKGYVCEKGISSCVHVCTFIDDICRNYGGCLYDPIREKPTCRCTDGAVFFDNKCQYEKSDDSSAILGGSIGGPLGGIALIATIISLCLKFVCKLKCSSKADKGNNVETNTLQDNTSAQAQVVQNNINVNFSQENKAHGQPLDSPPDYSVKDPRATTSG